MRVTPALLLAGLLALTALATGPTAQAQPAAGPSGCVPLFTGPDVEEQLCYDASDAGCPLFTLSRYKDETGWHKHCVGQ